MKLWNKIPTNMSIWKVLKKINLNQKSLTKKINLNKRTCLKINPSKTKILQKKYMHLNKQLPLISIIIHPKANNKSIQIPSKRGWISNISSLFEDPSFQVASSFRRWFLIWEPTPFIPTVRLTSSPGDAGPPWWWNREREFYPGMIFSLSWRGKKHGEWGIPKKNRWIESFEKFWVFGLMLGANSALDSIKAFECTWFVHNFGGLSQTLLKGERSNLRKCPNFISK